MDHQFYFPFGDRDGGCFLFNGFLASQGLSIAIGINLITVLTSGILGFPGLLMLYGINLYKLL